MDILTDKRASEIIDSFQGKSIAVVGDVMLDRYFWGSVSRVSPEAPVPVIDVESESYHLGGASNVANNLKALGIEPILCGVIGDDQSGKSFVSICNELGIDSKGLFVDKTRPTTVKTRIIGNNQHIARLDREVRDDLPVEGERFILDILSGMKNLAGIIFEDYNKGTITNILIRESISFAKMNNIPVFVDPKFDNFFSFKGVTVFKPNRREAQEALGFSIKSDQDIYSAGIKLLEKLKCENILLTLGKDGMMLFESNGDVSSVPTRARRVADVSGAGDTAIATLSAAFSGGATIKEAASLSNYASGWVCEQPGIVSITTERLIQTIKEINKLLNNNKAI